jgi:hypothetical protein
MNYLFRFFFLRAVAGWWLAVSFRGQSLRVATLALRCGIAGRLFSYLLRPELFDVAAVCIEEIFGSTTSVFDLSTIRMRHAIGAVW